MSGYDKKDAAEDTDATIKEVSAAWHDAKDAAMGDTRGGRESDTSDWGDRQDRFVEEEIYTLYDED